MAQICRDEHMPSDRTVREWMANDAKFSAVIADARVRGYDFIAADCLNIADDNGKDVRYTENGDVTDTDVIQRSKLRIETRLKLLAKWDPKRYGDKIDVNQQISGSMDLKIVIGESVNPVETTSAPDGDYD